jgi:hypothetical protein
MRHVPVSTILRRLRRSEKLSFMGELIGYNSSKYSVPRLYVDECCNFDLVEEILMYSFS